MKSFVVAFLAIFLFTSGWCQPVFKKMYGQFSPDNFELKEIFNSNNFILSNHNSISSRHTFFKIDETGQPYNQNYIYQPIGGSTSGSHKFYFRNDSVYDLVGKHFTPGSYPSLIFIARYDSSLQNMILSRFYDVRTSSPPGIISWRNFDSSYSLAGGYAISPGQYYPMMFKVDTGLNVNWSQSYRDRVGYVQDMAQAPDDGYFLLMHLVNEGMTLTKTDSTGTIIWSKNYSSPFRKAQRMLLLKDSTLLLLGYMNETLLPNNITTTTPCIIKTNEMGDILWSKKYDNPANPFIIAAINPIVNFDTAYQNKFVLTGSVINSNPAADMLLMLIDELGNPLWARKYGNNYFAELGSVCHQTSDGGFIVGGFNNYQINNFPPVFNQANITVIKTDSLGISDGCMEYPVTIYSEPDTDRKSVV
jgi:hypothetical protein